MEQIKDLIESQLFQNVDNLVINEDSSLRFHMYIVPEGQEQLEIHSADWYKDTFRCLVMDPNHDLLFPLISTLTKLVPMPCNDFLLSLLCLPLLY